MTIQIQYLRNCQNTRLVHENKNPINTLKISESVTAPYKENMPIA